MSNSEVKQEIDGVREMFKDREEEYNIILSPSINFTGGEPFLHEGI